MKTLQTERLVLRDFTMEDLADFYEYCKDPDTGIHSDWKPHENIEESQKILEGFLERKEQWAICDRQSGKVIGSIGLHPDSRRKRSFEDCRMMGYVLSKAYWGKGLMTEVVQEVLRYAFKELGLQLVSTYRFSYNRRSGRVMEKAGFVYEGTLRGATSRFDGALLDVMCFSLTKEEWENTSQSVAGQA